MLKKTLLATVALAALSTALAAGQKKAAAPSDATKAREELDKTVDAMRKDARATKADILGKTLALDSTQAAAFWPVYKQYEAELATVNDDRVAIIQDLSEHLGSMNDAKAQGLIERQIAYQEKRLALVKKYKDEFLKVLPATTVARFLQVDSRLNTLLDVAAASAIPLVQQSVLSRASVPRAGPSGGSPTRPDASVAHEEDVRPHVLLRGPLPVAEQTTRLTRPELRRSRRHAPATARASQPGRRRG